MENDVTRYSIEEHQTPAVAVISALAEINGNSPDELTPLYDTIDPDGLNSVIDSGTEEVTVEFEHDGCEVVVRADETVIIEPQEGIEG